MNETVRTVREAVLDAMEVSLAYQLNALRALRRRNHAGEVQPHRSPSQPEMVYSVLKKAGKALHIGEIIARAEKEYKVRMARESLASALTKKVLQHDRFVRTGKNSFGLLEWE